MSRVRVCSMISIIFSNTVIALLPFFAIMMRKACYIMRIRIVCKKNQILVETYQAMLAL